MKVNDFAFVQARDLLSKPEPVPWLIEAVVERGSLSTLFGPSGSGKSFLAVDWACCVAAGKQWNGKATEKGAVFFIAGEGFAGMKRRLRAWELYNGVSLQDAPLFFSTCPAALTDTASASAVADKVAELAAMHGPPKLIIIDTLARNLGDGDENSNADIGAFINNIDILLRARFGAAVLIVHHTGWTERERARGASALPAAMDAAYRLTKTEGMHILTCTKAKESEPPEPMYFSLETVKLEGWPDKNGELMTSAVLVQAPMSIKRKDMTRADTVALGALADALDLEGRPPAEGLRASIGAVAPAIVVREDDWRRHAYKKCISSGKADAQRKAFTRSRDALVKAGRVTACDGYYWLPDGTTQVPA